MCHARFCDLVFCFLPYEQQLFPPTLPFASLKLSDIFQALLMFCVLPTGLGFDVEYMYVTPISPSRCCFQVCCLQIAVDLCDKQIYH